MTTDKEFTDAVTSSISMRGLLKKLGLKEVGGNYKIAKRRIKLLGLSTEHFKGRGHLKGGTHNWCSTKAALEDIFKKDSLTGLSGNNIKRRMIQEGYVEWKCYCCNLTEWRNQKIPLELEHKNGDNTDNRLENLTLLCPNCHAQTKTYRGKNKKKI